MNISNLLRQLDILNVRLEAHGGRLRYFPQHMVPASLVEEMRTHKKELLFHLFLCGNCWPAKEKHDTHQSAPCPQCRSLNLWQTMAGIWRCQYCDAKALEYSRELAEKADCLRRGKKVPFSRGKPKRLARAMVTKPTQPDEKANTKTDKQKFLFL